MQFLKRAKDLTRHFSKNNIQVANKCMKWCLPPLVIREMQSKLTTQYHMHTIAWLKGRRQKIPRFGKDVETRILNCLWESKLVEQFQKIDLLYVSEISIHIRPSDPLLSTYSAEMLTYIHNMFKTAPLITNIETQNVHHQQKR